MQVRGEDDLARLGDARSTRWPTSLQRQIRQLEDLSRVQRRFVSDVSHELRTPLTTVRMAGRRAARGPRASSTRRSRAVAELLQTQLDRFEALLADLLEISRYDAGRRRPGGRADRPARLVARARRRGDASRWPSARAAICVSARPAGRASPRSTRRRVERILRNLLANAIEHGEGRPIEVHGRRGRRRGRGRGPRPRRRAAPGEAAAWSSTGSGGPTRPGPAPPAAPGSGLAIALEDAQLHGGWLQAWGEPGDGCQFRLTLPRRIGHRARAAPRSRWSRSTRAAGCDRSPSASPTSQVRHAGVGRCLTPAGSASRRAAGAPRGGARGLRDDPHVRPGAHRQRHRAGPRRGPGRPDRSAPRPGGHAGEHRAGLPAVQRRLRQRPRGGPEVPHGLGPPAVAAAGRHRGLRPGGRAARGAALRRRLRRRVSGTDVGRIDADGELRAQRTGPDGVS